MITLEQNFVLSQKLGKLLKAVQDLALETSEENVNQVEKLTDEYENYIQNEIGIKELIQHEKGEISISELFEITGKALEILEWNHSWLL